MSNFCTKMETLVNQQKRNCESAVLNRGPYQLAEEFQTLEISSQKWFQMNIKQRESALQKFWKTQLPSVHGSADGYDGTAVQISDYGETATVPHAVVDNGYNLSVQPEESGLAGVPLLLLKDMYARASKLLESKEAVMRAPSNNQNAFVIRNDVGGKPYYVYQEENGKVICDECPTYKSTKICCHAIVVAEKCGGLKKFLSWYKRSQKTISATSYMTSDSSKTVGKKGDQAKSSTAQRKGGRSNRQIQTQVAETGVTIRRADLLLPQQSPGLMSMTSEPQPVSQSFTQAPIPLPVPANERMMSSTQPLSHPTSCQPSELPSTPSVVPSRAAYPSPAYGAFILYPLNLCPPLVSTCFGCSRPLKPGGQIAPPPGNIVIVSNMLRSYFHNHKEYHKPSNVYFHCQVACIRAKQPFFQGSHLQIPLEAINYFTPEHHRFLREGLGLYL